MTITEDVLFQCVSIQIRTDTYTEATNECFNFRISSAATVSGLTVEPSETKICIVDRDCEYLRQNCHERTLYKTSRCEMSLKKNASLCICFRLLLLQGLALYTQFRDGNRTLVSIMQDRVCAIYLTFHRN